jgi:hypothetical protein
MLRMAAAGGGAGAEAGDTPLFVYDLDMVEHGSPASARPFPESIFIMQ